MLVIQHVTIEFKSLTFACNGKSASFPFGGAKKMLEDGAVS
jgi:hypothetical protein